MVGPTASPGKYRESAATSARGPRDPPPAAPRSATAAVPSAPEPAPNSPPARPSPASPSSRRRRVTWSGNPLGARRPPPRTRRPWDAASWETGVSPYGATPFCEPPIGSTPPSAGAHSSSAAFRDSPIWGTSFTVSSLTDGIYRLASFASRLWNRCRRPLDPHLNRRPSRVWPRRRSSVKQAFDADVLIDLRPMNTLACPNQTKLGSLARRGFGQPPGPRQRHADYASVGQVGDDLVLSHADLLNARIAIDASHSVHTTLLE